MLIWSQILVSHILIWFQGAFVSAMALTLLHSLWQGALIGLLGLALDARLKRSSPDTRCGAFSLLLLAFFALWIGTFCYFSEAQTHPAVTADGVLTGGLHQPLMNITSAITSDQATVPPRMPILQSVFPALVACWTLGVCVLSLRHLGGLLLLSRLSRTATVPCPPAWEDCMARMAARMGIRRRIRLRCSTDIDVPYAFGLFRSSILLPFSAMTGLAPEQVEALIAHELAHLARRDVLLNLVQVCLETVLFYHPVVGWLSTQIRAAREQHCDDLALQVIGDRALYARALYSLEESRASIPHLALGAKGDASAMTNTHLLRRIQRVLGVSVPDRRDPWLKGALALGAAALGLATFLPVHAYSPAPGSKPSDAPPANQPPTAPVLSTMAILLDIDGDKIELSGTGLTPDTLLKVNGKEGRFGDLTPQQQKQLRKAVKDIPAVDIQSLVNEAMSKTSNGGAANGGNSDPTVQVFHAMTFRLDLNGDKVELHSTDLTPDTPLKVNGKEGRFGDLTPQQQKQLQEAMKNVSASVATSTSATTPQGTTFRLDLNGDKIEFHSTSLTPDTPVAVNGAEEHFGDLTPQQQKQLQEAVKNASVSATPSASTTTSQGATVLLDINGDKIEFHSPTLTPDTPVTVNGKEERFGDLTPQQQKQLQEAAKNVSATVSSVSVSSSTTPQGTTFQLDLNGDKIELHSTSLTPDTPVTVNGKEGRFGDLTPQQQRQITEHLPTP